jgi:hypothetical protein
LVNKLIYQSDELGLRDGDVIAHVS